MTGSTLWALGKEEPSFLFRKQLPWWELHEKWKISLNYITGNFWQNINGLWDCCLQPVLQPHCLVRKWQGDACSKSCSQNQLPCFSSMKKQNKSYPCQTCQCVTLKILWWRNNLRVYKQNEWGRTKVIRIDFFDSKYKTEKKNHP